MIRDDVTGELIPSPSESGRKTDWGYETIAAGGVPYNDSDEARKAAKLAAERATLLNPSIPVLTVAHLPWIIAGMGTMLVLAIAGSLLNIPGTLLIAILVGLVIIFAGPVLAARQAGDKGVALALDDPVLMELSNISGRCRKMGRETLRQYAFDEIEDEDAMSRMVLLSDCSDIADRLNGTPFEREANEQIDNAGSTQEGLQVLLYNLQVIEDQAGIGQE